MNSALTNEHRAEQLFGSSVLALVAIVVYSVLGTVLMLNLLVAMMNATYKRIANRADLLVRVNQITYLFQAMPNSGVDTLVEWKNYEDLILPREQLGLTSSKTSEKVPMLQTLLRKMDTLTDKVDILQTRVTSFGIGRGDHGSDTTRMSGNLSRSAHSVMLKRESEELDGHECLNARKHECINGCGNGNNAVAAAIHGVAPLQRPAAILASRVHEVMATLNPVANASHTSVEPPPGSPPCLPRSMPSPLCVHSPLVGCQIPIFGPTKRSGGMRSED